MIHPCRLLKSLTSIGLLSMSPFMVVSIYLVYWSASMLGTYVFIIVTNIILRLFTWSLHNVLSYLLLTIFTLVYFVWYEHCYSGFLLISVGMEYPFPSPCFHFVCALSLSVSLVEITHVGLIFFLYPLDQSVSFGWGRVHGCI